jgi:cytochrome c551
MRGTYRCGMRPRRFGMYARHASRASVRATRVQTRKVQLHMRLSALTTTLLVAAALFIAGCGGPKNSGAELAAACERQIEQIMEAEEESDTPTAKSTQERLDDITLVECAGQRTRVVSADAAADEADADSDADADEEPADEEEPPAEEEPDAVEEPEPEPVVLDPAARSLFESSCGGCHALSDAGTNGAVGPNLDGTSLDAEAIAAVIANGQGAMPPGLLEGDDATSVAEYVAGAAATN